MEELRRNAGTQFDPSITAEFIEFLSEKYSVSLDAVNAEEKAMPTPEVNPGDSKKAHTAAHSLLFCRYILNKSWTIVETDENFEHLTGYSGEDTENGAMNQMDLIPEEDRLDYVSHVSASLAQSELVLDEHRLLRKDGTTIYVFCCGRVCHDPGLQGCFEIIVSDVSETYALKMLTDAVKSKADLRLRSWESTYRTDSLTGLLNHAAFKNDTEMKLLEGSSTAMMIMMDVDRFKQYNDTYGHQNGDEYLILIAQNLQASLRGEDYACRMGGDEFAAMLFFDKSVPETTIRARAHQIFDKVNLVVKAVTGGTSVSMGAVFTGSGMSFNQLYNEADAALYKAKNEGRERIVVESR